MKRIAFVALLSAVVVNTPAHGGSRVSIRVSPAMAFAPALLTVRATVEPNDDNRMLAIEVDSSTYRRTSEIPLDSKSAPRTNVIELKDVPPGLYEVRAILIGASGPVAKAMQLVRVE